jgi:hypothetical protein
MSKAAEHRPRDCAQYHGRAKSQPGLGTGRNGKGESDHAKDGNRPGLHDRSPADCRTLLSAKGTSLSLGFAASAGNPLANTVSNSEANYQSDYNFH